MSGTDIRHACTVLLAGTEIGYAATRGAGGASEGACKVPTSLWSYAMSGTDVGYAAILSCAFATRCPVLTTARLLRLFSGIRYAPTS
eukprot:3941944-Rhodomonas_salina.7